MFAESHLGYSKSQPVIIFQIYDSLNIYSLNLQEKSMQARKFHLPPFDERQQSVPPGYCLVSQCDGLLLLRESTCDLLTIYNPITRLYERLPLEQIRSEKLSSVLKFALIYDSSVGKYKVFAIDSGRRNWSVFTQGEKEWKFVDSPSEQGGGSIYSSLLFVGSKLQFTVCVLQSSTFRYVLNSIDVLNDELVKMDTPFDINEFHLLSELKGSLGITNIFPHYLETWVLDDRDQSLWTRCSVIRFDPLLSSYRDQGLDIISFDPLLLSSTKFYSMNRKLFVQLDYKLAIYDMEKKELNEIKLSEIISPSGCLCEEAYGFHINSLVNWI